MTSGFHTIKDEIRVLGLDDGPFSRGDDEVIVVGTVFRGGSFLDGVVSTRVEVDGLNSTDKLIELINNTKFRDLRVVMLDGLAFGGFNLVDINRLYEAARLPVIAVVRGEPDFSGIRKALENLPDADARWALIEKAGDVKTVQTKPGRKIRFQFAGIREEEARKIIEVSATRSLIPEPIRVAHLIAQGIVLGESRGRA